MAIDALLGKVNAEALAKAVEKSDKTTSGAERQGPSFQEVLNATEADGQHFANMLGMGTQDVSPTYQLEAINGAGIDFTPGQEVTALSQPDGSQKVVDLLSEVNKGQMQMDSLVNHVLYSGRRFNNQELLVIQAHVFHYAQMTELTVKVAEQGVSSVKSVLNTQVQ